jgi:hypothetical protein
MRYRWLLPIGLGAVAIVLVLVMFSRESGTRACPAIGYAYVGDVELVFSQEPESVAACFGEGCTPAVVSRSGNGRWMVPQSEPYLSPPASVTKVYVQASGSSGARISGPVPIETESTGEYPYGQECGGPFRFKPVQVPLV